MNQISFSVFKFSKFKIISFQLKMLQMKNCWDHYLGPTTIMIIFKMIEPVGIN